MQINEIDDPRLVKGLAHPLRIQILRALENRVASPSEVAEEIGAPLGNVSYHVRFLARVGLIELTGTKPRRGAVEHYYRAVSRVRVTDRVWSQVPDGIKSGLISGALAQLGPSLVAAGPAGGFDRKDALASWRKLSLDERGFKDLAAELRRARERAREIERESAERMSGDHASRAVSAGVAMLLFEAAGEQDGKPASAGRTARRPRREPAGR